VNRCVFAFPFFCLVVAFRESEEFLVRKGRKVVFSDVVSSRLKTRRTVAWSSAWCAGGPGRKRENRGEVH
jgi:hypothetical protein